MRETAAAKWRGILDEHARSGLSIAQFCRERGVSQPSFYQWRRRLAGSAGRDGLTPSSASFVRLRVAEGSPPNSEVVIQLPAATVRVPSCSPEMLVAALTALVRGDVPE